MHATIGDASGVGHWDAYLLGVDAGTDERLPDDVGQALLKGLQTAEESLQPGDRLHHVGRGISSPLGIGLGVHAPALGILTDRSEVGTVLL